MKKLLVAMTLGLALAGCATTQTRVAQEVSVSLHVAADVEQAAAAADKAEKDALVEAVRSGKMTVKGAQDANDKWEAKFKRFQQALHVYKDAQVTASHVVDMANHGAKVDIQAAANDLAAAYATLVQAMTDIGVHLNGVN